MQLSDRFNRLNRRFNRRLNRSIARFRPIASLAPLAALSTIAALAAPTVAQTWTRAYDGSREPDGILNGISGMAVLDDASDHATETFELLVARDNKDNESDRFEVLRWEAGAIVEMALAWNSDLPTPIDLEGLTVTPDGESFLAIESDGDFYHVTVDRAAMTVTPVAIGHVPPLPEGSNLESIELFEFGGQTLVAWAHRGQDDDPGVLYWGAIDLETLEILPLGSQEISVLAPVGNVRHISDLAITRSGQTFISSTTDNGNDGPFESIVYEVGSFGIGLDSGTFGFEPYPSFIAIGSGAGYKIEAIVRDPLRAHPAMLLGTDDENLGSAIGR